MLEKDSKINLAKDVVSASLDGGTYVVEYTIDNPHQGEKVTAKSSADWVTDINTNISGALTLKVAANTSDERRELLSPHRTALFFIKIIYRRQK